MAFSEKYISKSDNTAHPDPKKKEISDDAFAVGEIIEEISMQIARSR